MEWWLIQLTDRGFDGLLSLLFALLGYVLMHGDDVLPLVNGID